VPCGSVIFSDVPALPAQAYSP
jgi:hypothetical protein